MLTGLVSDYRAFMSRLPDITIKTSWVEKILQVTLSLGFLIAPLGSTLDTSPILRICIMDQSRLSFQHDELTMPFTLTRETNIRMPILDEETIYTALFVLENSVPVTASRKPTHPRS